MWNIGAICWCQAADRCDQGVCRAHAGDTPYTGKKRVGADHFTATYRYKSANKQMNKDARGAVITVDPPPPKRLTTADAAARVVNHMQHVQVANRARRCVIGRQTLWRWWLARDERAPLVLVGLFVGGLVPVRLAKWLGPTLLTPLLGVSPTCACHTPLAASVGSLTLAVVVCVPPFSNNDGCFGRCRTSALFRCWLCNKPDTSAYSPCTAGRCTTEVKP